jgi:hypothetical protein
MEGEMTLQIASHERRARRDRRLGRSPGATVELREHYRALAAMDERARRRALKTMIVDEICLDVDEMRWRIEDRLGAWIGLAAHDHDGARRVAEAYRAVAASLLDQLELRSLMVTQGVLEREVWFELWLSQQAPAKA